MNAKFKKVVSILLSVTVVVAMLSGIYVPTVAKSLEGNPDIARWAAAEGMVLIENENDVLPVKEGSTVALFGRATIDYTRGGGGSADTYVDYTTNILQGMQNYEKEGKISLVPELVDFYTLQVTTNGIKDDANITITDDVWNAAASATETAVVTIGRTSREGADRDAVKGDYYLTDAETELLTRVAAEFENTVVVLNVGAVMDTSWIDTIDGIDSVLIGWLGGMEGGNATADVLMGEVNPSGKLVDTWAKSYDDYPSSETFKETVLPEGEEEHQKFYNYVNYTEDIFVGYRYFETIPSAYDKVNYEFGYGLSYTTFTTTIDEVKAEGDNIVASVTVKNTGDKAGKEVVQLYFTAPDGVMTKPKKELEAFDKTDILQPNESQTLTLSFPIADMSSYDDIGQIQKSAYVMEAGDYKFFIGNSVRIGEYAEFKYTLNEAVIAEQLTELCEAIQLPERLQADGTYESAKYFYPVSATEDTTVQMENFSERTSNVKMERFAYNSYLNGFSVGGISAIGDYIEYGLNAETAGQYAIYFSYADGYGGKSDIFDVTVNGVAQVNDRFDTKGTSATETTAKWFNFSLSENYMLVNLNEGENTIRFTAKKINLANFDYMLLRRVGDVSTGYSRIISADGVNKIEAESFDDSVQGVDKSGLVLKTHATYGTWMENMNKRGNTLKYNMNVEKAGKYKLILTGTYSTTALNNFGILTKVESAIFGDQVFQNVFSLAKQKDWYTFGQTNEQYINLPMGDCTMWLTVQQTVCPNIESFTLEYVGEADDRTIYLEQDGQTQIQTETYVDAGWSDSGYPMLNETSTVEPSRVCVAHVSHLGNYIAYHINAQKAGTYNVTLTCANGSSTFKFEPNITVNGVKQSVSLDIETTRISSNPWYNFVDQTPFAIQLEEGMNILKMECTANNKFPNIDYFTISYEEPVKMMKSASPQAQSDEKIMLIDVYNNPDLMDAFLEQMTDDELGHLLKAQASNTNGGSTTGGIGNLREYGIPHVMTSDGPQGLRFSKTNEKTTAWPSSTCLASSWDVDVVEAVSKAFAKECAFYDIDIILAPGMNIHRDPLCGRNFEYYSEDPLLTGKIGASFTNGFQSEGVGVSVKHFATNNREQNRMNLDSRVSERALREIYLRGFEIVVKEADPYTIMSSYNLLNGTKVGENYELLTGILRNEWGYQGLLFTDYANNSKNVAEILAGNDLKMLNSKPDEVKAALADGVLTREHLKTSAERVINTILKSNSFKTKILNPAVTEITDGARLKAGDDIIWAQNARWQATNDEDGGLHLSHIDSNVYTEYEINAENSGIYSLNARIASIAGNGSFRMLVDGTQVASFSAVSTGAYTNWTTIAASESEPVYLEKGRHTLRLEFDAAGFNLNWIEFNALAAVNENTGEAYESITDALDNATAGDVVKLTVDATEKAVYVDPEITLDLNGHSLTVKRFVGFKGSNVIDTSSVVDGVANEQYAINRATKTGAIYAPKDNVILSNNGSRDEEKARNSTYMPIYDANSGCYRFVDTQMRDDQFKVNGGKFSFIPIIGGSNDERNGIQKDLLATDNITESGIKLKVRVTWTTDGYDATQDFAMKDEMAKNYIASFGYVDGGSFINNYRTLNTATFTGAALKQADKVYISAVIVSETGAEVESIITEVDTSTLS